jgi:beta-glucosidase
LGEHQALPRDFLWGVAASAYQIEGAARDGGRGSSIWDDFSHMPGKVAHGHSGDVACDHYHRYLEDVHLMAELGVNAYRFSIGWPRVEPEGDGRENPEGMDFYSRLVDALLERGIVPVPTLYHWDLPSALEARGGWRDRDTAQRFAAYAERMASQLGDRAKVWITHNEPWCQAVLGHGVGVHAPGMKDPKAAIGVAHHLLLSHGLAHDAMKANRPDLAVGLAVNPAPFDSPGDQPEDLAAVRLADGLQNRWFIDPLVHGRYPEDVAEHLAQAYGVGPFDPRDLRRIGGRCDFLGINYYNPAHVERPGPGDNGYRTLPQRPPLTQMGWEVEPDGLTRLLTRLGRDYPGLPLYVTENGVAYPDRVGRDGRVHDADRIRYLTDHVGALRQAVAAGAPVRGYFYWSLLDNFEWQFGYTMRFGLVAMGPGLERQPKDSFDAYRGLIADARAGAPVI